MTQLRHSPCCSLNSGPTTSHAAIIRRSWLGLRAAASMRPQNKSPWEDQPMKFRILAIVVTGIALLTSPAFAQTPAPAAPPPGPPPAYGPPISLAQAKQVAAAAEAEALKLGLHDTIAIVEPSGDLVYFERMEGGAYAHIQLAQHKAQSAARFRLPTMAFQERVQAN